MCDGGMNVVTEQVVGRRRVGIQQDGRKAVPLNDEIG